jgi:DNA end-binding protein Ku
MRSLWKGTLSFGLVTIPVQLYPATDEKTLSFNQLRGSDHSRIGYQRVAKSDGEVVDYGDIVKGYEYEPGRYVVFEKQELDALRPPSSRTLEVLQFVPLVQIDPVFFKRAYYLAPDPAGAKAYRLLSSAMADRDTVALCKVTLRDKEHLATLRLHGEVFVLETMWWPDEVREVTLADFGIESVDEPRPQEVKMAESLVEQLTEDFDPTAFSDEYRERVLAAVQAKVEGEEITVVDTEGEPAEVLDLVEALKASVEQARQRRRRSGTASEAS